MAAKSKASPKDFPRHPLVATIARYIGIAPTRVRNLLRHAGYEGPPWTDARRVVQILLDSGLQQAQKLREPNPWYVPDTHMSAAAAPQQPHTGSPGSGVVLPAERQTALFRSMLPAPTPDMLAAPPPLPGGKTFRDGRGATVPALCRELQIRPTQMYDWLHRAEIQKPWNNRPLMIELAANNGNPIAARMLSDPNYTPPAPEEASAGASHSPAEDSYRLSPAMQASLNNARILLEQHRELLLENMASTGRKIIHRHEMRALEAEEELNSLLGGTLSGRRGRARAW